jgi:hypothetical protein
MKIDNSFVHGTQTERPRDLSETSTKRGAGQSKPCFQGAASSADVVSLERQQYLLQIALQAPDPTEHAVKLERLSRLVAAGGYEPDSDAVSTALLKDAFDKY